MAVVAINGGTVTLKMPAGTLDVPQTQLQIVNGEQRTIRIVNQSEAAANVPKSEFAEGSSWNMCGSTTNCDQVFPITVVAINGEMLTLKMPAGTLDVPRSQLQIVSRENRTVRIVAKAR